MRETLDSGSKGLGSSPGVLGQDCALTVPLPTLVRNWVPSNLMLDESMTQSRLDAVAFFAVVSNRRTGLEEGGCSFASVSKSFQFFGQNADDSGAQYLRGIVPVLFTLVFLFSFFTLRTTGLYTKTLAKIIYRDITRFSVVFLVVFIGFCGAMFMALKATGSQELFT